MNVILAKLLPSWHDFVTARRHIKECLTLNELSAVINVEELPGLVMARKDQSPSSSSGE